MTQIAIRFRGPFAGVYKAVCLALPGCAVYGRSLGEARTRIRQAVRGYMEHMDTALPRELARQTRLAPVRRVRGHGGPGDK